MNLLKNIMRQFHFINRGFSVIAFDWRGQGMSDREIKDQNKSY